MSAVDVVRRSTFDPAIGRSVRARRALENELFAMVADQCELISHSERDWRSITFAGAHHTFTLAFDGREAVQRAETMIAALPEHLFSVPGHLVADAAVIDVDHRADRQRLVAIVEVLLLEND